MPGLVFTSVNAHERKEAVPQQSSFHKLMNDGTAQTSTSSVTASVYGRSFAIYQLLLLH